jgi:anaerobic ribonucleoside-triphosphate reductase activating protein
MIERYPAGFLRIHLIIDHTRVLGPYLRAAIWLQGCFRNCPGCMSQTSRELGGGKLVKTSDVAEKILNISDIEGVTISGGEPFLQARELLRLLRTLKNSDLGIIIYTGYYLNELISLHDKDIDAIISEKLCDILIDGPYIEDLNDGMALKGSSNQRVIQITDRYAGIVDQIYSSNNRSAEIHISENDFFLVGIPSQKILQMWNSKIKRYYKMNRNFQNI